MNQKEIIKILKDTGVLLEGHFILTSGLHSDKYMQCAKVFQYPHYSEKLTDQLAKAFLDDKVDLVVGPALGGIILSYEMARSLKVKNIFAERENGLMTLRRGFHIDKGARVLVVEDVVTTGGSVKEVIKLVDKIGGNVVGVGSLVDRSNGKVDFGVKFSSLMSMDVKTYEPDSCPLCKENVPLVKPGSRAIS